MFCVKVEVFTKMYILIQKQELQTQQIKNGQGLFNGDANDSYVIIGLISLWVYFNIADGLDDFHSFDNTSKHCVFVVQPGL